MPLTTPSEITKDIRAFCKTINSDEEPVFVAVEPSPRGVYNHCFQSVLQCGLDGEPLVGWVIWERPRAFIEAEMHCVLQQPDGSLRDVTPKPDGETLVLFVPDHYHPMVDNLLSNATGVAPANKRKLLTNTPLLRSWLKAAKVKDHIDRGTYRKPDANKQLERFMFYGNKVEKKYP